MKSDLSKHKAGQVIVELIRQAGGELVGKTKLYKAFYLAHLFYAAEAPGYLTDWPIVRMPNGPGIDEGDDLIHGLVTSGALTTEPAKEGPYPTTRYRLAAAPEGDLDATAVRAIEDAIAMALPRSAAQLSELTHEFSKSWNSTPNGRELNIYIDIIPDEEFTSRRGGLRVLHEEIASAFDDGDAS